MASENLSKGIVLKKIKKYQNGHAFGFIYIHLLES